jgi:hypothetical protein
MSYRLYRQGFDRFTLQSATIAELEEELALRKLERL